MNTNAFRALFLGSCALALSSCASLGGTVSGSFDCRAPAGTCAPMSTIDDRAVTKLDVSVANAATPTSVLPLRQRTSSTGASNLARSPDRVLRIIFPAHVDAAGTLHEAAVVHAVVERGAWVEALTGPAEASTPSSSSSRSLAPSSLREAVAGASAPAIEGLDVSPFDQAPHIFEPAEAAGDNLPSAAALEAARAGYRIGSASRLDPAATGSASRVHSIAPATALARPPLGESPQQTRDRASAAKRAADLARPALDALGTKPAATKRDIKGQASPAQPGGEETPQ